MNEILLTGLAVAVIVMIVLDIIEKIGDYRIKKVEKKLMSGNGITLNDEPPKLHAVQHDIITLNVGGIMPREVALMHDNKFISEEICEKLATEIMDKNLINLRTFSTFETGLLHYEATLRVVAPKGGFDDVEEEGVLVND